MKMQHESRFLLPSLLAFMLGFTSLTCSAAQPSATAVAEPAKTVLANVPVTSALIQNNDNAPISPELKKWLAKNNVKILTLIDASGQTKALDADGKEIKPCGKVVGTRISGGCRITGMTPVSINSIKVLGYTPQAAAPLALNGSHPVKGPIDDPCLSIDIGGEWMEICW